MSIGKVIRKYRKLRNMTQEEMAVRLGVTAPAVNKWENENSFPDITLLAPIARLLHISLDTRLSFREELTAEEINGIIGEVNQMLKEKSYEEAFQWAKKALEQYPNCEELCLDIAICFDAYRTLQNIPDGTDDEYLSSLYVRLLDSKEETIRVRAADALVGFCRRKGQYEKAEEYLRYFSAQNPERKRKLAQIYGETGRMREAYGAYEELLFVDYQRVSAEFHGMQMLALQEKDMEKAHKLAQKQAELAKCFEMGRYYEAAAKLEVAVLEKDADAALGIMEEMLANAEEIESFRESWLFAHMEFKEMGEEFRKGLKETLRKCFRDEESYDFLKADQRWKALVDGQ